MNVINEWMNVFVSELDNDEEMYLHIFLLPRCKQLQLLAYLAATEVKSKINPFKVNKIHLVVSVAFTVIT